MLPPESPFAAGLVAQSPLGHYGTAVLLPVKGGQTSPTAQATAARGQAGHSEAGAFVPRTRPDRATPGRATSSLRAPARQPARAASQITNSSAAEPRHQAQSAP